MLTSSREIDWAAAVEASRDWIARLVAARTGAPGLTDDVMQELSLAVARSDARPTRPEEVAPWLCKIVIRQCALVMRSQIRQQRKLYGYLRERATRDLPDGDPIFWLLDQERREIVREELASLDADVRRLLVWKYVHGSSYEKIGARLGVSKHVAEYRTIEARKQLRRRLLARGIEGDESP